MEILIHDESGTPVTRDELAETLKSVQPSRCTTWLLVSYLEGGVKIVRPTIISTTPKVTIVGSVVSPIGSGEAPWAAHLRQVDAELARLTPPGYIVFAGGDVALVERWMATLLGRVDVISHDAAASAAGLAAAIGKGLRPDRLLVVVAGTAVAGELPGDPALAGAPAWLVRCGTIGDEPADDRAIAEAGWAAIGKLMIGPNAALGRPVRLVVDPAVGAARLLGPGAFVLANLSQALTPVPGARRAFEVGLDQSELDQLLAAGPGTHVVLGPTAPLADEAWTTLGSVTWFSRLP